MRAACLALVWALVGPSAAATPSEATGSRPAEAIETDRAAARAEVQDLERRVRSLSEQSASRRTMLGKRLRALYKLTEGGYLRLLVGGTGGTEQSGDEAMRDAAVRRLLRRDLAELAAVKDEMRQLDLDQQRREKALAEALRLSAEPLPDTSAFGHRRGSLTRPLPGFLGLGFGPYHALASDGKETAIELNRRGVEMRSRVGQEVRAAAAGIVRWVGPVAGMELGVILDHGEGYATVTARLRSIQPGVAVDQQLPEGARLGEAASATVYFELAQGGTPLNPIQWLTPPASASVATAPTAVAGPLR